MRKSNGFQAVFFAALFLLVITLSVAHAAESSKFRKFDTVKAKKLNTALSDLCKTVSCVGIKPVTTDPIISTIGLPPLTQGQGVVISGKNFGDSPGSVTLKGSFLVNGAVTTLVVDLPILPGYWTDTFIGTGPIPSNLIGFDQDVLIQVKSASNVLSRERKAAFVSQREIKLLPSSAMKGLRGVYPIAMVPGVTNTIGVVFESDANYEVINYEATNDVWTAKLRDHQKFHSWVFGHWVGNFPQEPIFSIVNNDLTFSITLYLAHTAHNVFNAGYWVNMYYTTPTGMD